jgi:hypothetical protein
MKANAPLSCGLLLITLLLAQCRPVQATAIASSQLQFSNLQINPVTGTVELMDVWTTTAFANADAFSQFDSQTGQPSVANATSSFSSAHGEATASGSPDLHISGLASSGVAIPTGTTAQGLSTGRGGLLNSLQFMLTGGSGPVSVNFSIRLDGSLHDLTAQDGLLANSEVVFNLQLDGNAILFADYPQSIGVTVHVNDTVTKAP